MLKLKLPTKTVTHPSSFWDGARGVLIGLSDEYLMFNHRPPKSAPLCSRAAAALAASLKAMIAMFLVVYICNV